MRIGRRSGRRSRAAGGRHDRPPVLLVASLTTAGEPLDPSVDGAQLTAYVEIPEKSEVAAYDRDEVLFSGWVLARSGRTPEVRVRLADHIDDSPLATTSPTERRPEVADLFDPVGQRHLEAFGFAVSVPVTSLEANTGVVVEFDDNELVARSAPYRFAVTPASRISNVYVAAPPSPRNAIDLFAGDWSSELPAELAPGTGNLPTFRDERILKGVEALGGIEGMKVLELGPLEAGHTALLEELGAGEILAIESHSLSYLKCLVVKEVVGLKRASFLLGDFMPYLRSTDDRYDLTVASGVLYHQREPLELLSGLARVSDRLLLWTVCYDEVAEVAHPGRFADPVEAPLGNQTYRLHPKDYGAAWSTPAHRGGPEPGTRWMERDGILECLANLGYGRVEVVPEFDNREGALGATFLVVATR